MKLSLLLSMMSLITISHQTTVVKCFFYFEKYFTIYNVKSLYQENKSNPPLNYTFNGIKGELYFNICGSITPQKCSNIATKTSSVVFVPLTESKCVELISGKKKQNQYSVINMKEPLKGFKIDSKQNSSFEVQVICNKKEKTPKYQLKGDIL